jgi:hypothetical protein
MFQTKHSLEERKKELQRFSDTKSSKLPVIVQPSNEKEQNIFDPCKFAVPKDVTCGQFLIFLRKRLNKDRSLKPEEAMFLFIGKDNILIPQSCLVSEAYTQYKDDDGFLYMYYAFENAFGY